MDETKETNKYTVPVISIMPFSVLKAVSKAEKLANLG